MSAGAVPLFAQDWMAWPSTYTHDAYGSPVDQFVLPEQPLAPHRQDFVRSGYRHFRSTLQAGQSADNMHVVESWGAPVIPYEQWRFPYRPYAVPYPAWGPQPPYGIFNGAGAIGYPGGYSPGPYVPGANGGPPSYPPQPDGYSQPNPGHYPQPGSYDYRYTDPQHGFDPSGQSPSRGFPLTPNYGGEPWYDGTYPDAPALRTR